jgi:hypothetical protein
MYERVNVWSSRRKSDRSPTNRSFFYQLRRPYHMVTVVYERVKGSDLFNEVITPCVVLRSGCSFHTWYYCRMPMCSISPEGTCIHWKIWYSTLRGALSQFLIEHVIQTSTITSRVKCHPDRGTTPSGTKPNIIPTTTSATGSDLFHNDWLWNYIGFRPRLSDSLLDTITTLTAELKIYDRVAWL